MTDPSVALVALLEYLRKVGAGLEPDFLREAIRVMSEQLMELEVQQQTGAERYERTAEPKTQRDGYRERLGRRGSATLGCASPSCATAATSPASWSRAGGRSVPPRRPAPPL